LTCFEKIIRLLVVSGLVIMINACHHNQEKSFHDLTTAYIQWYFKSYPSIATITGYHEFDNKIEQSDEGFLKENLSDVKRFDLELSQIDRAELTTADQVNYGILQNSIEG